MVRGGEEGEDVIAGVLWEGHPDTHITDEVTEETHVNISALVDAIQDGTQIRFRWSAVLFIDITGSKNRTHLRDLWYEGKVTKNKHGTWDIAYADGDEGTVDLKKMTSHMGPMADGTCHPIHGWECAPYPCHGNSAVVHNDLQELRACKECASASRHFDGGWFMDQLLPFE